MRQWIFFFVEAQAKKNRQNPHKAVHAEVFARIAACPSMSRGQRLYLFGSPNFSPTSSCLFKRLHEVSSKPDCAPTDNSSHCDRNSSRGNRIRSDRCPRKDGNYWWRPHWSHNCLDARAKGLGRHVSDADSGLYASAIQACVPEVMMASSVYHLMVFQRIHLEFTSWTTPFSAPQICSPVFDVQGSQFMVTVADSLLLSTATSTTAYQSLLLQTMSLYGMIPRNFT